MDPSGLPEVTRILAGKQHNWQEHLPCRKLQCPPSDIKQRRTSQVSLLLPQEGQQGISLDLRHVTGWEVTPVLEVRGRLCSAGSIYCSGNKSGIKYFTPFSWHSVNMRLVRALGSAGLQSKFCERWGSRSAFQPAQASLTLVAAPVNLATGQVFLAKCVQWQIQLHSLVLHRQPFGKTHPLSARVC